MLIYRGRMSRNPAKATLSQRIASAIKVFRAAGQWRPQSIDDLDRWMDAQIDGHAGDPIALTSYFSGVMQISQTIASVSFPLFKREPEGRRRPWLQHPVYTILNSMTNEFVNAFKWRETVENQTINWGNSYSYIERDNAYRPKELFLLEPGRMKIELKDSGEPVYIYTRPKGGTRTYNYREIFHLAGFGPDPYVGYSVVQVHRAALTLGLQQQDFLNSFIRNGVHTSGVFKHPGELGEQAHDNLRRDIEKTLSGSSKAGKVIILEEGMNFETMSMPLKDAEFLGSRIFQIQEIARILNMPPHKLKDMSQATFSNIEHQQIEYVTDTIRPWAERWEAAVNTQLLTPIERKKGFSQHDLTQLMRGDMKTMMDAQRIARFAGLIDMDEGREVIGLNPHKNPDIGKRVWQPVNMMDAESDMAAGEIPEEDRQAFEAKMQSIYDRAPIEEGDYAEE